MRVKKLIFYYKDFLSSPQQYDECELYWKNIAKEILKEDFVNYTEWFKNVFGNGKKIEDGNPIFTLKHSTKNKAIRIIQEEPKSKRPFLYGWLEKAEEGKLDVFVLVVELSNQTEPEIRKLIFEWFKGNSKTKFEEHLETINETLGKKVILERNKKTEEILELLEVVDEINDINEHYISKTRLLKGSANVRCLNAVYSKKSRITGWSSSSIHTTKGNSSEHSSVYLGSSSSLHSGSRSFISHSHSSEDDLAVMIYAFIMFVSLDNHYTNLTKINSHSYFGRVTKLYGSKTAFVRRYYGLVERINELSEKVGAELSSIK
jgi:hypothetical protein